MSALAAADAFAALPQLPPLIVAEFRRRLASSFLVWTKNVVGDTNAKIPVQQVNPVMLQHPRKNASMPCRCLGRLRHSIGRRGMILRLFQLADQQMPTRRHAEKIGANHLVGCQGGLPQRGFREFPIVGKPLLGG
ncbi:MAG TPA: hypothetical protein VN718_09185 [Rhizomicrobium sp.]|nr:hypothetical protein [Rhizomicrobium sp.]